LNFVDRFSKNTPVSIFIQIRPLEAESFQADGQTKTDGHDEANSRFSQFYERA